MTAITLKRIAQLPAFCGPASLSIMLSQHGVFIEQKDVAKAAQALANIETFGMRLDQLALAVRKLAPHLTVWAKRNAKFQDLDTLINSYNLPVGIEWQGVWTEEELKKTDNIFDDGDLGHYSVVTGISLDEKKLMIQDPSLEYYLKDRPFALETFDKRWFDTNEVGEDAPDEAKEWMHDYHVLFVIAPKNLVFPESLGLKKVRIAPSYKKRSATELYVEKLLSTISTLYQKMRGRVAPTPPTVRDQSYDLPPRTGSTLSAS
jgi:hypothetical protein